MMIFFSSNIQRKHLKVNEVIIKNSIFEEILWEYNYAEFRIDVYGRGED